MVWDPCNVLYLDEAADPVHEEYPKIAGRVAHVHVKDARREGTRAAQECVELGTGEIDFPGQFRALRERGYAGWVTLETHWRGARALDPESQHLPAGHAFSAGAEAGEPHLHGAPAADARGGGMNATERSSRSTTRRASASLSVSQGERLLGRERTREKTDCSSGRAFSICSATATRAWISITRTRRRGRSRERSAPCGGMAARRCCRP